MAFDWLFRPGKIGPLPVKNRLIMVLMVCNYADERGHMTER